MSFEFFISRRLSNNNTQGKKVSRPIVRISIVSISLAIVVNLIAVAIVTGFQNEVREKAMGFTAPLFVSKINPDQGELKIRIFESEPIPYSEAMASTLRNEEGVNGVSPVLYRPTILQSKKFEDKITLASGKDTTVVRQEIAGVLMKGVDETYDWTFLKQHMIAGEIPKQSEKNALVLSETVATNLNYKVGDTVLASFFTSNRAVKRDFVVKTIFNSGFGDYDQQLVFTSLNYLQEVSGLDFKVRLEVSPMLNADGSLQLEAITNKADDAVQFNWNGMTGSSKISWEVGGPREVELIARTQNEQGEIESDTLQLTFDWKSIRRISELSSYSEIDIVFENNSFKILGQNKSLTIRCENPCYKEGAYISGYEIGLTDFSNLEGKAEQLRNQLQLKPDKYGNLVQVTTVKEAESDLFAWLDFLDVNVYIIITLMLLIGVINVGSAILVIIIVRTNFVGIMKAMGASNWSIRKVFVYEAGYLIVKGILVGNILGISLCFLQKKWKVFSLDPSVYYLDAIPIHFSWMNLLLINLLTIVVCLLALVIPSIVVTRITPVKSIRFN